MPAAQQKSSVETAPGIAAGGLSFYVFAALTYGDTHARKHSMVEELCRRGFEAVYVEKPSSRGSAAEGTISLNRSLPWLSVPSRYMTLPTGVNVLPVPKKLSFFGLRPSLGRGLKAKLINRWFLAYFERARRTSGKPVFAMITTPVWEPLLRGIPFDHVCYDCVDDLSVLQSGYEAEKFQGMERRLVERADFIAAVTEPLADNMRKLAGGKDVIVMPNAVDPDYFEGRKDDIPAELLALPRPRIGFVGQVAKWIDIDLILHAARTLKDYSFVMVGKEASDSSAGVLRGEKNIHSLGYVPFEKIPGIVNGLDVCLNPFRPGPISDCTKPVKPYEYLSLGKPVVSTMMPQLLELGDALYMSEDREGFVADIRKAATENDPALIERRIGYAMQNTWAQRIELLLDGIARNCNRS